MSQGHNRVVSLSGRAHSVGLVAFLHIEHPSGNANYRSLLAEHLQGTPKLSAIISETVHDPYIDVRASRVVHSGVSSHFITENPFVTLQIFPAGLQTIYKASRTAAEPILPS